MQIPMTTVKGKASDNVVSTLHFNYASFDTAKQLELPAMCGAYSVRNAVAYIRLDLYIVMKWTLRFMVS